MPFVQVVWAPAGGSQEYGVTALTVATGNVFYGTSFRLGRRFTVGATALDVNRLRVYAKLAGTYRVTVHRNSDGVEMVTSDIVVAAGEVDAWREASVTSTTLAASTSYIVSARVTSGTTDVYRIPSAITYNAAHTHDEYLFAGDVDTAPGTSTLAAYFWADIGFLT